MITNEELDDIEDRAKLAVAVAETLTRADARNILRLIEEVKNLQNLLRISITPRAPLTIGNLTQWKDAVLAALPPE